MDPSLSSSQNAVLQKYLVKKGETTWAQVCDRVCTAVAFAESGPKRQEWYENFMSIMVPMKFIPGGSILANCQHGTEGLLNCFVLESDDHMVDITQALHDSLLTTKFRGGVGMHIGSEGQPGYIRPKGASYKDGSALGPCAVFDMISSCNSMLTTGNRARRGAFLFSMHWRHPDIWEFIQAKSQSLIDANLAKRAMLGDVSEEEFTEAWAETHLNPNGKRQRRWHNANISVHLDDEFFELLDKAYEIDKDFAAQGGFDYVDRNDVLDSEMMGELNWVWTLFNEIAQYAHDTADPGILFIDNAKRRSPIRDYILTTNPCGELFLPPNSACNLGSVVMPKFLVGQGKAKVTDTNDLRRTAEIAVRFLDNVLTVSKFATPAQKQSVQKKFRQVGLGIIGWSDFIREKGVQYDSEDHLALIDVVGGLLADSAYRASERLASSKGPCGVWEEIKDIDTGNAFDHTHRPRRNSTVLSIAPTGSISQLAGCSWAFEPDFGLAISKQVFVDASKSEQQWVQMIHPSLEALELTEADKAHVVKTGSIYGTQFAADYPDKALKFKIAREISPDWHMRVQAQWQNWIDSSISKTINLPADASVEDIKQIYLDASAYDMKGITVYRSGTLESEPIKVGTDEKPEGSDAIASLPSGNEVENKTYEAGCKDGVCSTS